MLNDILKSGGKERNEANNRCMKAIFEPTDPKTLEEPWYDFANNLAVDLDDYEPNPERRKESASYHDDERLEAILITLDINSCTDVMPHT